MVIHFKQLFLLQVKFNNMFVVGLCIIYEVFFLCYRQQQKKKQFKENYTLPLNTISNDNVRVA